MSVHNAAGTICDAVDSLLRQTHPSLRIVVYDDASTDATAALLQGYDDPRLDLRLLAENRGLTCNLQEGVERALSVEDPLPDYIARMDADDIAHPDRLAKQVAFLEANPDIDVLGTSVHFFDETGAEILGRQPEHHDDIAIELFFGFTMLHPTVMLRSEALRAGKWNYDPAFKYSQDFDLWTRMLPHHRFANLPDPLMKLRDRPQRISRVKRNEQQVFSNILRGRQVRRLLSEVEEVDIEVLSKAARGDPLADSAALKALETLLVRLISANKEKKVYSPDAFGRAAADFHRGACLRLLKTGSPAGVHWVQSALRPEATPQRFRTRARFLLLALLAMLRRGATS